MALVPRWRVPLRARILWNVLLSFYSGVVGLILVLDRTLAPDSWPWVHEAQVIITLVSVLALATFVDSTRRSWYRSRKAHEDKTSVAVRNQLSNLLVTASDSLDVHVGELGCGLFLVQGRGIVRPERLWRSERVRLINDLHESEVTFTKGKATVGECWKIGRPAYRSWIGLNREYAGRSASDIEALWPGLRVEDTRGLTLNEFCTLLGKYAEVRAVPFMVGGTFQGCLALDRRWNKDDPDERCLLDSDLVTRVLQNAATTLVPVFNRQ